MVIKFSLRSKTKGKPASIYVRLRDGKAVDLVAPIGKNIYPQYWSDKTQNVVQRLGNDTLLDPFTDEQKAELNDHLSRFKVYLLTEYNKKDSKVNNDWLKDVIERFELFKKGEKPGDITVCAYIQKFIEDARKGIRLTVRADKMPYSPQSIGSYISLKSQLEHFQNDKRKGRKLKFSDISMDFYSDFIQFFKDKSYKPNSIGKHIRLFKVMMNFAREDGVTENMITKQRKFSAPRAEVDTIYLTKDELQRIYDLKLSGELEMVRDIFYLGCCIAQRISDWRISPDNIRQLKTGRAIEIYHQKTGHRVLIPISDQLEIILRKYNDRMPTIKELPNAKINLGLKTIGQKAKIKETVLIKEQPGYITVTNTYLKWQLITSHTGRRTGATLMYLDKIEIEKIQKILGHASTKQTMEYIKIGVEENADMLSTHSYFRNNLKVVS